MRESLPHPGGIQKTLVDQKSVYSILALKSRCGKNTRNWAALSHVIGEGSTKFWTSLFTSGLLPNIWQTLVEFPSVNSEDGVRKKRTRVKYNGLSLTGGHNYFNFFNKCVLQVTTDTSRRYLD